MLFVRSLPGTLRGADGKLELLGAKQADEADAEAEAAAAAIITAAGTA